MFDDVLVGYIMPVLAVSDIRVYRFNPFEIRLDRQNGMCQRNG